MVNFLSAGMVFVAQLVERDGHRLFRCAESPGVADVSALREQVIGFTVGQGAPWCPARWVSVLDVLEHLWNEFRLGDGCDDA